MYVHKFTHSKKRRIVLVYYIHGASNSKGTECFFMRAVKQEAVVGDINTKLK